MAESKTGRQYGVITCKCGASWTGMARAHCGGCHELFSGPSSFDKHRSAKKGYICVDPASVGLVQLNDSIWQEPIDEKGKEYFSKMRKAELAARKKA